MVEPRDKAAAPNISTGACLPEGTAQSATPAAAEMMCTLCNSLHLISSKPERWKSSEVRIFVQGLNIPADEKTFAGLAGGMSPGFWLTRVSSPDGPSHNLPHKCVL